MTERQIRRAIASQVAIQAVGRGSIRNPDAEQPYLFICPDKDTSDTASKPNMPVARPISAGL